MKKRYIFIAIFTIILVFCSTVFIFGCTGNTSPETFKITYSALNGGEIVGEMFQTVIKGESGSEVTARAREGYIFEGWTDGVKEATRKEENVTENKNITAFFKLAEFTFQYSFGDGGYVKGAGTFREVKYGTTLSPVEAIPYENYEFDCWSDGVTTAKRQDLVTSDQQICAYFKLKSYQVTYVAGEHGKIEGAANQSIIYGKDSESVTAVPDTGYKFIGWSDGYQSATRRDRISKDTQLTANFEIKKRTFQLNYNMVTEGALSEIELTYFETDKVTLPVPTKDKFTFCGWYRSSVDGKKLQVSDEYGNIITEDDDLFEGQDYSYITKLNCLNAKWEANEKFAYTYKILMIYVTDVQAWLKTQNNGKPTENKVYVDYQITELERQVYHNITIKLEEILEDLLDGLVDFEIDEYFTTQTLGTESFGQNSGGDVSFWPWRIPELTKEMRQQYQSVLTTLNFNEYTHLFHASSGSATDKYGCVYFESRVASIVLEELLDLDNCNWENLLSTYVHELAHTIEMRKNYYSFHSAAISNLIYKEGLFELEAYKRYYLCEIEIDGEKVGIPYGFWKEDIENPYIDKY